MAKASRDDPSWSPSPWSTPGKARGPTSGWLPFSVSMCLMWLMQKMLYPGLYQPMPAELAHNQGAGMGKLARTVILSILFVGTIVIGIIATGHGAEAWATVRPVFVGIADFFKIALPG